MTISQPDDARLLIRCPSCSQRFKVGEELRGRMVECGACEHRFRIEDDVIVRAKKIYPGEKKGVSSTAFLRVPKPVETPAGFQHPVANYLESVDPTFLEPISPLRILGAIFGVGVMAFIAMLLVFQTGPAGALNGMTLVSRLMMSSFASLLGLCLLIYGNPRAQKKAAGVALLISAGLIALAFHFGQDADRKHEAKQRAKKLEIPAPEVFDGAANDTDEIAVLRKKIGTDPLVAEIERNMKLDPPRNVFGIWIRDLLDSNRILVRDYIISETSADPSSHIYPRGDGNYLMVLIAPKQNLEELPKVLGTLGKSTEVYDKISVVEVDIENKNFVEGPIEKLSNRDDPAFYELNKRELDSIDKERIQRAVIRLVDAEPRAYREDISRRLVDLLGNQEMDFESDLSRALLLWATDFPPASTAAVKSAQALKIRGKVLPPPLVDLIAKTPSSESIKFIYELWLGDPTRWEEHFSKIGQNAEETILSNIQKFTPITLQSSIRLLGQIGGTKSIGMLSSLGPQQNPETRILIDQALSSIRQRAGN